MKHVQYILLYSVLEITCCVQEYITKKEKDWAVVKQFCIYLYELYKRMDVFFIYLNGLGITYLLRL